jgi:hypothetical protein
MHKLEIYTTGEELADIDYLHEIGAEIIGGIAIGHYRKFINATGAGSAASPAIPAMSLTGMKVEVFTSSLDNSLLQRLSSSSSVLDVRVHRCDSIDICDSTAECIETASSADLPATPDPSPTKCLVEPFTAGYLRLRVETGKNPDCLTVLFRSLAALEIDVQNGRKFRQGDTDFVTLTIAQTNEKVLRRLQEEIEDGIAANALEDKTRVAAIPVAECSAFFLELQGSSSMPAIKLTAKGRASAIRAAFHEGIVAFDWDVSIGRITGSGNRVEDLYYLKAYGHNPVTEQHLTLLGTRIIGENHA